jgi:hypothetical protein
MSNATNGLELQWFKSTRSHPGANCVEAAFTTDRRLVRDSKLGGSSPVLAFDRHQWRAFTARIRSGDLG